MRSLTISYSFTSNAVLAHIIHTVNRIRINSFYVYLALMAVCGVALTMVQTASTTLLQESSTPEMSGRIFGLYGAAYSSFLPIGMVVFGLLSDRTSMRLLMVVSGGLLILMAAVMFLDKSFYQHGFTSTAMVSNSSETI